MNTYELNTMRDTYLRSVLPSVPMITVGMGTCGIGNGAQSIYDFLRSEIEIRSLTIMLKPVGCFGFCAEEPLVVAYLPGEALRMYRRMNLKEVKKLLELLLEKKFYPRNILCCIPEWDHHTAFIRYGEVPGKIPVWNQLSFFKGQKKFVLRNAGFINPESVEDYIAVGGYHALSHVLTEMRPDGIIEEVTAARMRGRGGAGFPTGVKWLMMHKADAPQKYIICNADEGDPGAYMNRNEIESDPHAVLEGMMIGAYAMGASKGIAYVRAEYPLAVKRFKMAIEQATALGLMGTNIMNSGFSFECEVVEGAGAFVCGEETALIASIEGRSGRPMPRPPYPAAKGLYGCPTNINNVETWCNIPLIIEKGSGWFLQTGTEKSPGTKVFSLVGKIKNTGLVEVPLGTSLEQFIYEIGEGTGTGKRVKAVQTGGPSGGCIPAAHFKSAVDYESLASLGAIMGSGGMVVMDQDNCMVDVARYFLEFNSAESCGKCTPCREGLSQALAILTRICNGQGSMEDLTMLEILSSTIKDTALCGLGQTAPNPILTTLRYFRSEYEEHIVEKRCHAGVCERLFMALCENSCPMHMNIPGYIELIKEDRIEDAFELTLRDNPLPGTIGRICHFHCQMRCRRDMLDEPVSQGEVHRYLADTMYKLGNEERIYKKLLAEKLPATGKRIAVVGAGPAGLTAAFYLLRLGHQVTVYDAFEKPGGVLRYGIPQYRLPHQVLEKETDLIVRLGAQFEMNKRLGVDIQLSDLSSRFDAVYLAFGAWKEVGLNIPGEDAQGVFSGTGLLRQLSDNVIPDMGRRVAVVGAGNVAVDVARSLWRHGKEVTIVYRRDKCTMPANHSEITESEAEQIQFRFMSAPVAIETNDAGQVKGVTIELMTSGGIDASGRRRPLATGKFDRLSCDAVVIAIGEEVDNQSIQEIETERSGRIEINAFTGQTNLPNVFAGGDAVTGPSTAAEAMGMAKKASAGIDEYLMGQHRFDQLFRKFIYRSTVPVDPVKTPKNISAKLAVKDRTGNFLEVDGGYSGLQARAEVSRCLRCDVHF